MANKQTLPEETAARPEDGPAPARALLAVLLACGLRRHEVVELNFTHLKQRGQHWAIVDLMGKAGHMRTIPMPDWVKANFDVWIKDAGLTSGRVFRRVNRAGQVWGESMTEKVVWHVVREFAVKAGIEKLAPHDLRRTCARLCHIAGGELEQIQFLLGHVSIQTMERHLGCKQRIRSAVNDRIGIEPKGEQRTVGPLDREWMDESLFQRTSSNALVPVSCCGDPRWI